MARFPVDIYGKGIGTILTYVIPLGIMITFPAKAFMGILDIKFVVLSFVFGLSSLFLSLKFWRFRSEKICQRLKLKIKSLGDLWAYSNR